MRRRRRSPAVSCLRPSDAMALPVTTSKTGAAHLPDGKVAVARNLPEEVAVALVFEGTTHAVMMATPADIEDFAVGFAISEGIIDRFDEILELEVVEQDQGIEARIWLREDRSDTLARRRRAMTGPVGCGLCGIESLEQAVRALPHVGPVTPMFSQDDVASATNRLAGMQPLYAQTRATHAAGFLVPDQGIVMAREDVGRHNALDKLIGGLTRSGIDPTTGAVVMTSRISVELIQKCAFAGIPMLIAVSAPTSTAVRLAEEAGITLAAFARGSGFDLYAHPDRIKNGAVDVA